MVAASAVALTGSSQSVRAGGAVYRGFAIRNTNGAAVATVRVWDNASAASGTLLDDIQLIAGDSQRAWYADGGIWAPAGIYVEIVAGTVEGSIRVG